MTMETTSATWSWSRGRDVDGFFASREEEEELRVVRRLGSEGLIHDTRATTSARRILTGGVHQCSKGRCNAARPLPMESSVGAPLRAPNWLSSANMPL